MPWRKVCFSKRASLYCSCLMWFFTTFFFTPSPSWCIFRRPQGLSTSLGAGQHTLRLLARRTRLLTFPEPSCWPNCTEGGPGDSRMCHRGFGSGPCPCTRLRSPSQGEGCQCSCRGAGSSLRTAFWAGYNRSRTSGAWRHPECSCPHTPSDWVPGCSCGPG